MFCSSRGDLGCLVEHARSAGYRAGVVAERVGLAPRELRRVFSASMGLSLKEWLTGIRSVEVKRRLLGDEAISEIARSVGFSHPKELARAFREAHGMTPSEFRKLQRRDPENG